MISWIRKLLGSARMGLNLLQVELRHDCVYVVECSEHLPEDRIKMLSDQWNVALGEKAPKLIVLDASCRLARQLGVEIHLTPIGAQALDGKSFADFLRVPENGAAVAGAIVNGLQSGSAPKLKEAIRQQL